MQGYTHTCAACDAKLKIHDRYVGRTLHCTSCGTEFLADPTLADIDDIIEELAPEQKRNVPWLPIIVGLVALIGGALLLGQADPDGFLAKLFRPSRTAGQFAELRIDGRDRVPAAMDQETAVFVVNALEDDDPGSLEALRVQGKIVDVVSGNQGSGSSSWSGAMGRRGRGCWKATGPDGSCGCRRWRCAEAGPRRPRQRGRACVDSAGPSTGEDGVNPSRTRRCDRGRRPADPLQPGGCGKGR